MTKASWSKRFENIESKRGQTHEDELLKLEFLNSAIQAFEPPHSFSEAQTLVSAKGALNRLNNLNGQYVANIGHTAIRALCRSLDDRIRKSNRQKGIAPGNQAKSDEAIKRKDIAQRYFKTYCLGRQEQPSKLQVYRDLKRDWGSLDGTLDLACPARSTFMSYIAEK